MKELEELKAIFLAEDIDEETRQDNLDKIKEWEQSLIENENFASWQESDITNSILKQAKTAYKDITMRLADDRKMTQEQRMSLWAKQDACLFLISLMDKDAKDAIEQVKREINHAITATI